MRKRHSLTYYLQKISQGIILSMVLLALIFAKDMDFAIAELSLYETMPNYNINLGSRMFFKMNPDDGTVEEAREGEYSLIPEPWDYNGGGEENINESGNDLITLEDIIFQPETDFSTDEEHRKRTAATMDDIDSLRDLDYLRSNFYIVSKNTQMTPDLFDVDKFVSEDLNITMTSAEPKVLIFHTHAQEKYADSKDISEGVIACGQRLGEILREKYGIESIHNTEIFDMVDGKPDVTSAYERMEPVISQVLKENPSIEIAIDLHRDGVNDDVRLVENINGKPTAQIMFVNGLTRIMQEGRLTEIKSLPNSYLGTNLAFSFRMQLAANQLFPDFTRRVYLNAYRYSLHMIPKSLLLEVGAQTNTFEEAMNAIEPFADILAEVILK